jgi:crossover junction endodeoxyribonuclease RuvC
LQKSSQIILGIDPGTLVMGYSIISVSGQQMRLQEMSVLKLNARKDNYERLQLIHQKITDLIRVFQPHYFAIEAPFFGKNVQSMLKLGRAQGVAIAAAMTAGLQVSEYSPKKIKQSITGNGNAGKEQVWKMLQQLLSLPEVDLRYFDASDALAVAVCHHFQGGVKFGADGREPGAVSTTVGGKPENKLRGWEEFIAKNPKRVGSR